MDMRQSLSAPRRAGVVMVLAALAAVGCSKPAGSGSGSAETSDASPAPKAPLAAGPSASEVEGELRKLLATWCAAQGKGDAAAYFALYEPATFKGTKRVREGGEKTYTFAAWKTDREKMLKGKPTVVADAPTFETWHAGALPANTARATFTQRWRLGRYEDHGKKTLTLVRRADGSYGITGEDMLTSSAGFDDAPDGGLVAKERDLRAWTSPFVARLAYEALPGKAPAEGMSPPRHLVLTVTDAAGKKEVVELFREETTDRPVTLGPIRPKAQKGVLFQEGFWWAGSGDYFRVVLDGERLVVKYKTEGETGPDDPPPPEALFEDQVRIALPPGAVVSAR